MDEIKNSETFRQLLNIVSGGVGSITELVINNNEITVRKNRETIFQHHPLSGKIFSINEQRFIYESVKNYFDSRYEFSTNLYGNIDNIVRYGGSSTISIKGLSSW